MLRRGSLKRHWPSTRPVRLCSATSDASMLPKSRLARPVSLWDGMPPLATSRLPAGTSPRRRGSTSSSCGSMPWVAHSAVLASVRTSRTATKPWPVSRSVSVVQSVRPSGLAITWPLKRRSSSTHCHCVDSARVAVRGCQRTSQSPGRRAMASRLPLASTSRPWARVGTTRDCCTVAVSAPTSSSPMWCASLLCQAHSRRVGAGAWPACTAPSGWSNPPTATAPSQRRRRGLTRFTGFTRSTGSVSVGI